MLCDLCMKTTFLCCANAFCTQKIPKTIENQRKIDDSYIPKDAIDHEIINDEQDDEFCSYYTNERRPKIMITTRPKCSKKLYPFIGDLMQMIPNAFYYPRGR
jgi:ribosome production factor 1